MTPRLCNPLLSRDTECACERCKSYPADGCNKLFDRVISGVQDILAFFDIQDLCLQSFCLCLGYDSGYFAGDLGMILDILQVTWV